MSPPAGLSGATSRAAMRRELLRRHRVTGRLLSSALGRHSGGGASGAAPCAAAAPRRARINPWNVRGTCGMRKAAMHDWRSLFADRARFEWCGLSRDPETTGDGMTEPSLADELGRGPRALLIWHRSRGSAACRVPWRPLTSGAMTRWQHDLSGSSSVVGTQTPIRPLRIRSSCLTAESRRTFSFTEVID